MSEKLVVENVQLFLEIKIIMKKLKTCIKKGVQFVVMFLKIGVGI